MREIELQEIVNSLITTQMYYFPGLVIENDSVNKVYDLMDTNLLASS